MGKLEAIGLPVAVAAAAVVIVGMLNEEKLIDVFQEQNRTGRLLQAAVSAKRVLDPNMLDRAEDGMNQYHKGYVGLGVKTRRGSAGVTIEGFYDDSPAAQAGLRSGDLITHVDGVPIKGNFLALVAEAQGGESHLTIDQGSLPPRVVSVKHGPIRLQNCVKCHTSHGQ